jgi:hypothetical protein
LNVATDPSPHLNHRLNHLGLDLLAEQHLAFLEDLDYVGAKLASARIDYLKFFFDA